MYIYTLFNNPERAFANTRSMCHDPCYDFKKFPLSFNYNFLESLVKKIVVFFCQELGSSEFKKI